MTQAARRLRRSRFETWGPVALWAGLILTMSGDHFGGDQTGHWLAVGLRFWFPDIEPGRVQLVNAAVRKAAHVIEYAVLGGLACNALRREYPAWRPLGPILATLALASACALLDEAHQTLLAGRTGSLRDVLLDLSAATVTACVLGLRPLVRDHALRRSLPP